MVNFYKVIDHFTFVKSKYPLKKYDVYDQNGNYIVSFGGKRPNGQPYDQFHDRIGYYSHYDHNDPQRRFNYYKRHGSNPKPLSAKYFSHKYLW